MFVLQTPFALAADSATNDLIETRFKEFRTESENAKSIQVKSSTRFTIKSTEGFEISGKIGAHANVDEQEPTSPKAYEMIDMELTIDVPEEEIEKNKIYGKAEFIVIDEVIYMRASEIRAEGLPLGLLINEAITDEFTNKWVKIDLRSDAFFGSEFDEIQESFNVQGSTMQQLSGITGISEATLEQMLQKFMDYDVLEFEKDPVDYKGYSSYTAKLNKTNAFAFFNSMSEMILREENSNISLADVFDMRKLLVKNKNLRLKVLIDEAREKMSGMVIQFATQFNDGAERVDISIISEMMFEHDIFQKIESPKNATSIEEMFEEAFAFNPLGFDEPSFDEDFDFDNEFDINDDFTTEEDNRIDTNRTYESTDAFIGDVDAPVTIVEFVDYECTFCKRFTEEVLPQIKENYIDEGLVKVVFREFPLANHQLADSSAIAAQCAHQQGKYYPMHKELFNRKPVQDNREVIKLAVQAGLDETTFRDCFSKQQTLEAVETDKAAGKDLGVTGTPAFFINGEQIVGLRDYDFFANKIEEALQVNDTPTFNEERPTSADEEDRFFNVMAETVCFMKDFTDDRLAPGVRPTQDRIKEVMDEFSPFNNDEIYNAVDRIARNHGFTGYDEIEIVGGIYNPTDARTKIVEQRIFETCFLDYDFE